jgi:hypothetical protein
MVRAILCDPWRYAHVHCSWHVSYGDKRVDLEVLEVAWMIGSGF